MTNRIAPSASVYALVQNDMKHQRLLNNVGMMTLISREIENTILKDGVKARVFSSFQRISSFLPQRKRYEQMAARAESVYVFAHFDMTPPPIVNVNFIPVDPESQFAKEWFVVTDAPNFFTALVTEEVDSPDDPRAQRMFRGLWSFDEEMVTIIQDWLSSIVQIQMPAHADQRSASDYRAQIAIMSNVISRLTGELVSLK
ncbi:MAG: DICT sensory domain-containing protein [Aggregatilineales bacterium]